jgi:hypothetical protein
MHSILSCGVYNVDTTPKLKITKVLTITSAGDTVAIPIKEFQKYNYVNLFDNYRFSNWNNYYWNQWNQPYNFGYQMYRPRTWYFRDLYVKPVKVEKPRVRINGPRSSNNNFVVPPINNSSNVNIPSWNNNVNNIRPANNTRPVINVRPNNTNSKPRVPNIVKIQGPPRKD